jgi:hypothetical protein
MLYNQCYAHAQHSALIYTALQFHWDAVMSNIRTREGPCHITQLPPELIERIAKFLYDDENDEIGGNVAAEEEAAVAIHAQRALARWSGTCQHFVKLLGPALFQAPRLRTGPQAQHFLNLLTTVPPQREWVRVLDLALVPGRWDWVRDGMLTWALTNTPCLTVLELDRCKLLTDRVCAQLVQATPSLTSLSVAHCTRITDHGVGFLQMLRSLKSLDLSGLTLVRDKGIILLLAPFPDESASAGSAPIVSRPSPLESMTLCGTEITEVLLDHLLEPACAPHLTQLDVSGCFNLVHSDDLATRYAPALAQRGVQIDTDTQDWRDDDAS